MCDEILGVLLEVWPPILLAHYAFVSNNGIIDNLNIPRIIFCTRGNVSE
jgi:hypothetical protein